MADWDLLLTDLRLATMQAGHIPYGVIEDGALAVANGRIAWLGPANDLPAGRAAQHLTLDGRWLTPALIDCHTHLVFAGNRAGEFAQRLAGASYEDIARAGGGIMSTVRATREASAEELFHASKMRLDALRAEGVATVEIKSGYGLDVATELRMLEVIRKLGDACGVHVAATFLGAHTVPASHKGKADEYLDVVCNEMLPEIAARGLADAVDAYCEHIAFSSEQVARVFAAAGEHGLPVKLHADQLSDSGGAELAASSDALSADHLEYTSAAGVAALASAGTTAVLLPGAFLTLGETRPPPVAALRDHGVPIAIATDCNPGTSPVCSLRATMKLATDLFRLKPEECLAGVTRNAARALGISDDRGTLEAGKRADLACWDIEHPDELSYWLGLRNLHKLFIDGAICTSV